MNLTGQTAPRFSLVDTQRRRHRLEDYRGRWLLMMFHRHLG